MHIKTVGVFCCLVRMILQCVNELETRTCMTSFISGVPVKKPWQRCWKTWSIGNYIEVAHTCQSWRRTPSSSPSVVVVTYECEPCHAEDAWMNLRHSYSRVTHICSLYCHIICKHGVFLLAPSDSFSQYHLHFSLSTIDTSLIPSYFPSVFISMSQLQMISLFISTYVTVLA